MNLEDMTNIQKTDDFSLLPEIVRNAIIAADIVYEDAQFIVATMLVFPEALQTKVVVDGFLQLDRLSHLREMVLGFLKLPVLLRTADNLRILQNLVNAGDVGIGFESLPIVLQTQSNFNLLSQSHLGVHAKTIGSIMAGLTTLEKTQENLEALFAPEILIHLHEVASEILIYGKDSFFDALAQTRRLNQAGSAVSIDALEQKGAPYLSMF
ncbi:MAG: hypothetical protein ACHP65_02555 [Legionellales bacterium]